MKCSLKATLAAVLLSSLAIVPAATVTVMFTADAAYAKSDNAGGKGGGKGGGNSANSGKSGDKKGGKSSKAGGKSGKSLSSTRAGKQVQGMFRKLTGQDKRTTKSKSTRATKKTRIAKTDLMHPSNLGNMNGALNANINAVLAHVRNGNTNGPVGHLAALAVANVNAEGAQEIVDLQSAFDTLNDELGLTDYTTVEEYYAAREDTPGIDPIAEIDNAADQDAAAVAAGYESYDDYRSEVDGEAGIEPNEALDNAIEALGGDPYAETPTDITEEEPDAEVVADAEADLEAQAGAEQDILSYWNKNEGASEEDEQELLDALNDRLVGEEDAIRDAMGETGEESVSCETEGECEDILDDEEVVLIVE